MSSSTRPNNSIAAILGSAMLGSGPYRERAFLSGGPEAALTWGKCDLRRLRYAILWGHYDGTVYRDIHLYAPGLKQRHDLYEFIRPVYSPVHRDVEFWGQVLFGGILDEDAGDGKARPSAVPILTDNEAIRGPIAQIWKASNAQTLFPGWGRMGAGLGDAPLMVVDDPGDGRPDGGRIYLKTIHPGTLRHVERDPYGNVQSYVIEEIRVHPAADLTVGTPVTAVYTEVCEKVGDSIAYTTRLDGMDYDWRSYDDGTADSARIGHTWTEPYSFVPLVIVPHIKLPGHDWGMAEMFPSLMKIQELDDVASKLDDAIRKTVDPKWLYCGVAPGELGTPPPSDEFSSVPNIATEARGDRDADDALVVADAGAKAIPLHVALPIGESSAHVRSILDGIERDHPELTADRIGDNASGKARRVATERIEALVALRRTAYGDALKRAHMMAISMGATKGYPGFKGFTTESFASGDLDHSIGDRPVFAVDEMDRLEEALAQANALKVLIDSGVPLAVAMRRVNFGQEAIDAAVADQQAKQAQAAVAAQASKPPSFGA